MHISEGILSAPVLAGGAALAAVGIAAGLKTTKLEDIPRVALLSSAFFVASFIHVPVGPSSAHLVLNGLCGLLLGWAAFPALVVGMFMQAVLFQYGGLTVLGVNTFNMAFPAVLCWLIFRKIVLSGNRTLSTAGAFLCGALPVLLSGLLVAAELVFTEESFMQTARIIVAAHAPIMLIEGLIAVGAVGFIKKVKPEILGVASEPGRNGFHDN